MSTDKIYLVGFMASGKTTVGRQLAARLGWQLDDVDRLIEAREHQTIANVFAKHGEPYFRAAERDVLKMLLPLRHVVISTGGGTFVDPDNRAAINMDGTSVWLDLPLAELIPRIPMDGRRPLAADRTQLELLYASRVEAYRHSHVRVNASKASASIVADRVLEALQSLPPSLQRSSL